VLCQDDKPQPVKPTLSIVRDKTWCEARRFTPVGFSVAFELLI
jgi:hypothetical protein